MDWKQYFEKIIEPFNSLRQDTIGNIYEGKYKDYKIGFRYHEGCRNTSPWFDIYIRKDIKRRLIIKRKTKTEIFFSKIGIIKEIQIGEKSFDETFYIDSASIYWTRKYISNGMVRDMIKDLFSHEKLSVFEFSVNKDEIRLHFSLLNKNIREIDSSDIRTYIEKLIFLGENLPEMSFDYEKMVSMKRSPLPLIFIYGMTGTLLITGIVLLNLGISRYSLISSSLYWYSLFYSIPMSVFFYILMIPFVKGRTNSQNIAMLLLLLSFTAFIIGIMGLFVFANGYLDQSQISYNTSKIIDKTERISENSSRFYLKVTYWQAGRAAIQIKIPRNIYDNYNIGDIIAINTKKGHLGHEWIVELIQAE